MVHIFVQLLFIWVSLF
uniref:Uncharacterized protein n=1 Tax=Arundo donax TaxID=35708 RepID=A0A0A9ANG0_ARUDO